MREAPEGWVRAEKRIGRDAVPEAVLSVYVNRDKRYKNCLHRHIQLNSTAIDLIGGGRYSAFYGDGKIALVEDDKGDVSIESRARVRGLVPYLRSHFPMRENTRFRVDLSEQHDVDYVLTPISSDEYEHPLKKAWDKVRGR